MRFNLPEVKYPTRESLAAFEERLMPPPSVHSGLGNRVALDEQSSAGRISKLSVELQGQAPVEADSALLFQL